tara:strand:- start:257 stop:424 length:168 start_codon:yes stop_codon:yes gene_type:complete
VVWSSSLVLFANHFGREAFTSLHERDMAQILELDGTLLNLQRVTLMQINWLWLIN